MNRDPDVYGEDVGLFKPERHLDADGKLKPSPADTKDEGHVTYGFGRRYDTVWFNLLVHR